MKWTLALGLALLFLAGPSAASHIPSHRWSAAVRVAGDSASALADVIALVRRRGWPAELGQLCPLPKSELAGRACLVQQVAFFENDRHGRAFNIFPLSPIAVAYVVILDLKMGAGMAYVATPGGELISASTIGADRSSTTISAADAQSAFQHELTFWAANLEQFDQWLAKRRYGPSRGFESTK